MACDICGKTGTSLSDLREIYQTDDIKSICPDSETGVNKQLNSLQTMTGRLQCVLPKRFMGERKERITK